jgi:hypothetical protein
MYLLKEANMVYAKLDLIMKKLEARDTMKKEVMHISDSRMTCEECGDVRHSGVNYPEFQEDVNYIKNNNYRPQQNQCNQQQRKNYQGNFQGNNNYSNYNQPPLRDLVAGKSKLLDQMSKKVASNDKVLENINSRMDTFTSTIKNQHGFNKMLESQLAQLAGAIAPLEKGKILGQPEDLETTNLVDIHNVANYYTQSAEVKWIDYSLLDKKDDPRGPVIPISIGCHVFPEAVCDFGASVNIMPKVIYEKILGNPLLYINMRLQLANQSICYPKGVLEEAIVRVG